MRTKGDLIGTSTEVGSCFSLKYNVRHVSYAISKLCFFFCFLSMAFVSFFAGICYRKSRNQISNGFKTQLPCREGSWHDRHVMVKFL